MLENKTEEQAKEEILAMVAEYCDKFKAKPPYKEGDRIPYASRVFDNKEMTNLVDSALEFWLTAGRYCDKFEKDFGKYLGVKYVSLVNSGSSANLLAFATLTSPLLGDRRVNRGDEVITVAAGFPTTVAPIIQYGAVPVFVDLTIPQYNIDASQLEAALSDKTKAVMIAHTLGNPFDLQAVKDFCTKHNLWLIEDNCDALGSKYVIDGEEKFTGTIGDIGTSSFYPPHHMTMGEGGAVYTEMQAAVGCAQLEKFPSFVERRRHNFDRLHKALEAVSDKLILPVPAQNSTPSWFGFLITCKEGTSKNTVVQYCEDHGVQTRMLFAGNITKQPVFDEMRKSGKGYRVIGDLSVTDSIMNNTFWIGVYPGMTDEMIDYMAKTIIEAVNL